MAKVELKIAGMHCASCSSLIQDVLEENPDISSAEVSLDENRATVEYDETKIQPMEIKKMIEDEGYKVK